MADSGMSEAEKIKFFEMRVRPVLAQNCYKCHGEEKQKSGLRLDNIGYILRGSEGGEVLVPGNADESHLYNVITYEDPDYQMPPKDNKLPDNQIQDIKRWINMGAPWPKAEIIKTAKKGEFSEEERAWWSFQPLKEATPPAVDGKVGEVANDVDKFILAKLSEVGLKQAPEAEETELVRRLFFNLHGIPPSPERLQAYLDDEDPEKYAKLVEQLLDSPRYGERWGQHWLDLARYAESDGYRQDGYRPDAWPYRDYVINSLNDDKPYDQFVREQLAGDEIAPEDPDVLVATGYLRHGIYEWNQADAEGQREIIETELADVTGELFLGMSVGCAKCHDHKFDPILQKDYYRMRSFFAPMQWRDDLPLATKEAQEAHAKAMAEWEAESEAARLAWDAASATALEEGRAKALAYFPEEVQDMMAKAEDERTPYEKQIAYLVERRMEVEEGRAIKKIKGDSEEFKALKPYLDRKPKDLQKAFVATDVGVEAPPTMMESRKGELLIEPGFLSILAPDDLEIEPMEEKNSTGRRLALANWITSPDNPLSTRVIVNRIWQAHFGRGLSVHTSDFGKLGEQPTHPELLDWLTLGFIENGWSLKWLHRKIVNSATYKQSSMVISTELTNKVDPENKLLWRMAPQRLDAEQARDTLLLLGGELKEKGGGPAADSREPVPSIYTRKKRNSPDEFLSRFDAPPGFQSVAKRERTNTPLQSLLMINGQWPLQRAKTIAATMVKLNPDDDLETLSRKAFKTVYGRKPTDQEVAASTKFLREQKELIESEKVKTAEVAIQKSSPVVASSDYFPAPIEGLSEAIRFTENTPYAKLKVYKEGVEELDFTLSATVNLDSIYNNGAVRTIASRWDSESGSYGWSVGVTGAKSRVEPCVLIVQAVGGDFQAALTSEVINSGIKIEPKRPYEITVQFSTKTLPGNDYGGNVTFTVKDLSEPEKAAQTVQIAHSLGSEYVNDEFPIVIGGRSGKVGHQWSGVMRSISIANGNQTDENEIISLTAADLQKSGEQVVKWIVPKNLAGKSESPSEVEALGDLFHALINSNEFLYLP